VILYPVVLTSATMSVFAIFHFLLAMNAEVIAFSPSSTSYNTIVKVLLD
jgi:Rad3-related DNA helicase